MDVNMSSTTEKIQHIELEILSEFKRICEKYSLQYFAIGGTCIGAIRHQGFIPWDDDIDIAMPLKDYKKFVEIAKSELREPYLIYTPEEHRLYQFNFVKIHDANTFYIRKNYAPYPDRYTGVFFDVMPIYGMGKTKIEQSINSVMCDLWLYRNKAIRLPYDFYPSTAVWNYIWHTTRLFAGKKQFNYYIEKMEAKLGKYPFPNSDKVMFGWRKRPSIFRKKYKYKNVFYYEDFAESIEVPFENTTIRVPKGYDRYLRMDFGDYMQLPPENQRSSSHQRNCVLDLENSYKLYQSGALKINL